MNSLGALCLYIAFVVSIIIHCTLFVVSDNYVSLVSAATGTILLSVSSVFFCWVLKNEPSGMAYKRKAILLLMLADLIAFCWFFFLVYVVANIKNYKDFGVTCASGLLAFGISTCLAIVSHKDCANATNELPKERAQNIPDDPAITYVVCV